MAPRRAGRFGPCKGPTAVTQGGTRCQGGARPEWGSVVGRAAARLITSCWESLSPACGDSPSSQAHLRSAGASVSKMNSGENACSGGAPHPRARGFPWTQQTRLPRHSAQRDVTFPNAHPPTLKVLCRAFQLGSSLTHWDPRPLQSPRARSLSAAGGGTWREAGAPPSCYRVGSDSPAGASLLAGLLDLGVW